jgi:glycosyltransferase involved in cell wall biosynthesis
LRVAQLSQSCLPITGGTETYVSELSCRLAKNSVLSEIVAFRDGDVTSDRGARQLKRKKIGDISVLIWPSYSIGRLRSAMSLLLRCGWFPVGISSLKKYLRTFDVLHFHEEVDLTFPVLMHKSRKPRVFSSHSMAPWTWRFYQRSPLARKWLLKSADLFHVFSNSDRDSLMASRHRLREV